MFLGLAGPHSGCEQLCEPQIIMASPAEISKARARCLRLSETKPGQSDETALLKR
jgi:hypothetical protein